MNSESGGSVATSQVSMITVIPAHRMPEAGPPPHQHQPYYQPPSPAFASPPPYGSYQAPPQGWQAPPPSGYSVPNGYQPNPASPQPQPGLPYQMYMPPQAAPSPIPYSQPMQHSPYQGAPANYYSQLPSYPPYPAAAAPSPCHYSQQPQPPQQYQLYQPAPSHYTPVMHPQPQYHHLPYGQPGGYYREERRTPTPPDPIRYQAPNQYHAGYHADSHYQQAVNYAPLPRAADQRQYDALREHKKESPNYESERDPRFNRRQYEPRDFHRDPHEERRQPMRPVQTCTEKRERLEVYESEMRKESLKPAQSVRHERIEKKVDSREERREERHEEEYEWNWEEPSSPEPVHSIEKEEIYACPKKSGFGNCDQIRAEQCRSAVDFCKDERSRRGSSFTAEEQDQLLYRLSLLDRTMQAVYAKPEDVLPPERRRTESRQYEDRVDQENQRDRPTVFSTPMRRGEEKKRNNGGVVDGRARSRLPTSLLPLRDRMRLEYERVYEDNTADEYSDLGAPSSCPRLKAMVDGIVKEPKPIGGSTEKSQPPPSQPVRRRAGKIEVVEKAEEKSQRVASSAYGHLLIGKEKRQYDHCDVEQSPRGGPSLSSINPPEEEFDEIAQYKNRLNGQSQRGSTSARSTRPSERKYQYRSSMDRRGRLLISERDMFEMEQRKNRQYGWALNDEFTPRADRRRGQLRRFDAQDDYDDSPSSSPTLSMLDETLDEKQLGLPPKQKTSVPVKQSMMQTAPRGPWRQYDLPAKNDDEPVSRSSSPTLSMLLIDEPNPFYVHTPVPRPTRLPARQPDGRHPMKPEEHISPPNVFTPVALPRSPSPDYWKEIDEIGDNSKEWLRANVLMILKSHWVDPLESSKKLVTVGLLSRILRSYDKCREQKTGEEYDDVIGSIFGYKQNITWLDFLREMRNDGLVKIHEVKSGRKKDYAIFHPNCTVTASSVHKKPFTE